MNFLELARTRYSVRKFKKDKISDEVLSNILEAGRFAPTACNNQPQHVYVLKSEEVLSRLASVCRFTFDAPTVLAVTYDKDREWKNRLMGGKGLGETDAAIVCTHMMLAAWDLGIGSCWVGYFNADQVKEILELPDNLCVSALLPIGYPAEDAEPLNLHSIYRDQSETVTFL